MDLYIKRLKEHLKEYKQHRLGVKENGTWKDKKGNIRSYGHILPKELKCLNIHETIRREFWLYKKDKLEINLHSDFHHLNSSQAMCFNFFYPVSSGCYGSDPVSFLLLSLGVRNDNLVLSEFEKIVDKEEGSNIDFYVELRSGFKILFEVKLSEPEFGRASADNRPNKLEQIYRPRLKEKISEMSLQPETFFKHYQLLRNVSYADSEKKIMVVFLYPRENTSLEPGRKFVEENIDPRIKNVVKFMHFEDLIQPLCSLDKCSWHYEAFREKYIIE